ncbi:MAG: KR domain-containing protein [Gammaproteobacteria bacterium]|nr:KR domain-containing protein [Gammaproteobacteria bacterium]
MQAVLSPKVVGTHVLHQLLKDTPLDFILFASSLTAIAGGVGQIDYCAANLFLDYFLSTRPFKHCQYQGVINWNAWRTVGMASGLHDSKIHAALYAENSLSPNQGMMIINAALNACHEQIIVSHISPEQEIKRIREAFQSKEKEHSSGHNFTTTPKDIKITVQEIWQDILGVETINPSDTFYSLGGDSLLAIQLLNALNSHFHVKLTLQELAYPHTLNSLIKLMTYQPIASHTTIIPLFPDTESVKNHDTTVYFIHPLGGTVFCYFPLANHLEKGYRYYTIQDPELSENQTLFHSISDIAHDYGKKILATSDHSKNIILIGTSFGGNIAIEIANYLKENTTKIVKKIILIDSWANLSETDFANTQLKPSSQIGSLVSIKEYYGENSERYHAIQRRLNWLRQYTPSHTQTPTVILKAQNLLPLYAAIDNEYNGWKDYCDPSIKKYTISGNHDTMLSYKYIPDLAKKINVLLKEGGRNSN